MTQRGKLLLIWCVIYLALTAGLSWFLLEQRAQYLRTAAQPESKAEWEAWKESVQRENDSGTPPVARRVPTADEQPATILLRDYFAGVCLTLLLVWTAFFGFLAMVITGVLRGTPPPARD